MGAGELAEMDRQLAAIRALLARKRRLAAAAEADVAALSTLRWELTRALLAYQRYKHMTLFDPAIARGEPDRAALGRKLKTRCIAAGERFRTYAAAWAPSSVAGRWPAYQDAVTRMIAGLEGDLAMEREEAARLLRSEAARAA